MHPLLEFLARLDESNIHYTLGHHRDSINVHVTVPGERWEVEFFEGGQVEIEVFVADGAGVTSDEARLEELFRKGT